MAEEANVKAVQVKLVLLGEAAVGKSSLVLRFCSNDFNENTSPTIGAAFLTQTNEKGYRWTRASALSYSHTADVAHVQFHSLAPMYYRNAAAAVVVYDITKSASLEKAKAWVKELQRQANPNIVICLVGNKLDLVSDSPAQAKATPVESNDETDESADNEETTPPASASLDEDARQVTREEAESYAKESNLLFFEASAKVGTNVGELFTEIAKAIPIEAAAPKPAQQAAGRRGEQQVDLDGAVETKKGGCC